MQTKDYQRKTQELRELTHWIMINQSAERRHMQAIADMWRYRQNEAMKQGFEVHDRFQRQIDNNNLEGLFERPITEVEFQKIRNPFGIDRPITGQKASKEDIQRSMDAMYKSNHIISVKKEKKYPLWRILLGL